MKIVFREKFFKFYYYLHYPIIFVNLFIFIMVTFFAILMYGLGDNGYSRLEDVFFYLFYATLTVSCAFLYFILTIISTITAKKITQNKDINIFEKISAVIFPILTIILYTLIF